MGSFFGPYELSLLLLIIGVSISPNWLVFNFIVPFNPFYPESKSENTRKNSVKKKNKGKEVENNKESDSIETKDKRRTNSIKRKRIKSIKKNIARKPRKNEEIGGTIKVVGKVSAKLETLIQRLGQNIDNENLPNTKTENKYFKSLAGKGKLYGNTKLLMIYFSKFLQKLCDEKYNYIKSAAVHPGAVDTEFMRFVTNKNNIIVKILFGIFSPLMKFLFKTPVDGAQTQLNLCYIPFNEFVSGAYYSDCKITKVKEDVNDMKKVMASMKLTINEIKKRIPETKIFDICNDLFKNK